MSTVVQAPLELMEEVAMLRIPPKSDVRLQDLMDRNNNGQLNKQEREELEALVEWSENLSLLRAKVLRCLGRKL